MFDFSTVLESCQFLANTTQNIKRKQPTFSGSLVLFSPPLINIQLLLKISQTWVAKKSEDVFFCTGLQSGRQRNPKTHVSDIKISEPKLVKQKSDIEGPVRVKESS